MWKQIRQFYKRSRSTKRVFLFTLGVLDALRLRHLFLLLFHLPLHSLLLLLRRVSPSPAHTYTDLSIFIYFFPFSLLFSSFYARAVSHNTRVVCSSILDCGWSASNRSELVSLPPRLSVYPRAANSFLWWTYDWRRRSAIDSLNENYFFKFLFPRIFLLAFHCTLRQMNKRKRRGEKKEERNTHGMVRAT